MKAPILAINFKAYPTAFGSAGLSIAREADRVAREYGSALEIIVAVPATEIYRISASVEHVKVYAQHVDPVEPGAHTGYIPMEAVKSVGARGTLVNHSEHRMKLSEIDWIISRAREVGLETLVCADTARAAAAVAAMGPTMIAIEPPELIGTGIAVSKAKPEVITSTLDLVRKVNPEVPVLTGAGITTGEDVEAAIRLGTVGVLVASAVMKAKNPGDKIKELAEAAHRAWKGP